ncbi:hypothetical protein AtubIFM54640_009809 [Aspergillus tubingensis]|nr:hypothetical protein AtubIFM54640_009809 [Aspergillus tubingensis]
MACTRCPDLNGLGAISCQLHRVVGSIDYSNLPKNIAAIEVRYLRGQLAGYLLSYTSLWSVKLSFIFFFRHLGNRFRAQRILWWVVLAFVIACYGGTLGVLDYACEMASFEDSIGPFHSSFPSRSAKVNRAVTEACASAYSIWYERVSLKVSTTLVRLELSVSGTGILSPAWLVFWNAIEICVAIMMACLASFWTFYTKLKRQSPGPRWRAGGLPPRDYASLERPILLNGQFSDRDKHNHSALSMQSHNSQNTGQGVPRGKTEEP